MSDDLDRVGKRMKMRDELFTMICNAAGEERQRLGLDFDADLFDLANQMTGEVWNRVQETIKARRLKLGYGTTNWKVIE